MRIFTIIHSSASLSVYSGVLVLEHDQMNRSLFIARYAEAAIERAGRQDVRPPRIDSNIP